MHEGRGYVSAEYPAAWPGTNVRCTCRCYGCCVEVHRSRLLIGVLHCKSGYWRHTNFQVGISVNYRYGWYPLDHSPVLITVFTIYSKPEINLVTYLFFRSIHNCKDRNQLGFHILGSSYADTHQSTEDRKYSVLLFIAVEPMEAKKGLSILVKSLRWKHTSENIWSNKCCPNPSDSLPWNILRIYSFLLN